jgi:cytochrome b561
LKGLLAMNDVALLAVARPLLVAAPCGSGGPCDHTTRVLHWTTLVLLAAVFALTWAIDDQSDRDVAVARLVSSSGASPLSAWADACWVRPTSPLRNDLPTLQRFAARLTHCALYALLILQPIVGILQVRATPEAAQ